MRKKQANKMLLPSVCPARLRPEQSSLTRLDSDKPGGLLRHYRVFSSHSICFNHIFVCLFFYLRWQFVIREGGPRIRETGVHSRIYSIGLL